MINQITTNGYQSLLQHRLLMTTATPSIKKRKVGVLSADVEANDRKQDNADAIHVGPGTGLVSGAIASHHSCHQIPKDHGFAELYILDAFGQMPLLRPLLYIVLQYYRPLAQAYMMEEHEWETDIGEAGETILCLKPNMVGNVYINELDAIRHAIGFNIAWLLSSESPLLNHLCLTHHEFAEIIAPILKMARDEEKIPARQRENLVVLNTVCTPYGGMMVKWPNATIHAAISSMNDAMIHNVYTWIKDRFTAAHPIGRCRIVIEKPFSRD